MTFQCTLNVTGTLPQVSARAFIQSYEETSKIQHYQKYYNELEQYYQNQMEHNISQSGLDFNSDEFITSTEFMTNADVPTIAFNGVVDKPVNPFTGKAINSNEKSNKQYVLASDQYRLHMNEGRTTFTPIKWYSVHTNMLDKNNWKSEKEDSVLPY